MFALSSTPPSRISTNLSHVIFPHMIPIYFKPLFEFLSQSAECATLLKEAGAVLDTVNTDGKTPLDNAIEDEREEMLPWFQEQGLGEGLVMLGAENDAEELDPMAELDHDEWVAKLAEAGITVGVTEDDGLGDGEEKEGQEGAEEEV